MNKNTSNKRIVIKIGTSTLTHSSGALNIRRTEELVKVISDIKNMGIQVVLVSSGAIGIGMGKLMLDNSLKYETKTKQAIAAVGQCELMYMYDKNFSLYNHTVAQVLLTADVLEDSISYENVCNTFEELFKLKTLPIVNENDTVRVEEIIIGDNDTLSAIVAKMIKADYLIILSDIDGLYTKDPNIHSDAVLLKEINTIDEYTLSLGHSPTTNLGTGGMKTKLRAAQILSETKTDMYIINSNNTENIYKTIEGTCPGTHFNFKGKV